jgi:hypothetical protein
MMEQYGDNLEDFFKTGLKEMLAGIDARDKAYAYVIQTFLERQRKQDDRLAQVIDKMKEIEATLIKIIENH